MMHPDTTRKLVSPEIGLGVFATAPIPRGTIVWARDLFDIVMTEAQYAALPEANRALMDHFGYQEPDGRWIVCWDDGRLINHSCAPTVRGVGHTVQIAIRDIAPGEEITCDYAECNLDEPMPCLCGAAGCRGQVSGRDLLTLAEEWDREVREVVAASADVPQPLWPYVLDPKELRAIFVGAAPVPSLRTVYLDRSAKLGDRSAG